ncbi:LOW QUALITY PROTEIN: GTP cyclohydrolase I type 1 [Brevundimonas abyssalis TAR-001]|uniref:GTP cyclohydrolase 1 n=1 Tax=Brevundimonas abyssalis TAR-001 TaxID=1391729 RepID=A0A8E0KHK2_9CAUL|nr:LOW QUALITY PROTEIN: GTP cyclohydrolase I type 1 [Brevundimonas abyssalis TAR-001]
MDLQAKPVLVSNDGDIKRPSREQAMDAVRTLIAWAGDNPEREGLIDTPKRVVDAYGDWFQAMTPTPRRSLSRTFEDVQGYDDMVLLRDIEVESHCEHHMAPFLGKAYVAYVPAEKVVGISKLARVVEIFSKRLQTQETLTQLIAQAIEDNLLPAGTAVLIDAEHQCMTTRGVHHRHVSTITTRFTGVFKSDPTLQDRFLKLARG